MNEFFKYIQTLPSLASIIVLILAIILVAFSKWDSIIKLISIVKPRSQNSRKKRTCGDCVLILFGIREKFEYELRSIDSNIIRHQMKFTEQKIQEMTFFLSQSFSDDIMVLGSPEDYERKIRESALYCEALKNSMLSVKDEIRRSFKENGFQNLSENEFSYYIKNKTKILITIIKSYLNQHYIDNDSTISHLRSRFENIDNYNTQKFEGWVFEIFNNARDHIEETNEKRIVLKDSFKKELDEFLNNAEYVHKC